MTQFDASYWIDCLGLTEHPLSCLGYFKESHTNSLGVLGRSGQPRAASSSVYFLQQPQHHGLFHCLQSDELFFYHAGHAPLTLVHFDSAAGRLVRQKLGPNPEAGQQLQAVVPAGCFMTQFIEEGSCKVDDFCLFGVVVSPGFDPADSTDGNRKELLERYPQHKDLIVKYTKE